MRRLLNRVGIIPRWLPVLVAAIVIVALGLVTEPTQADPPVAAEATAMPPATPSPAPVQRILFSGCPIDFQSPEPSHCYDWSIYEINSDGSDLRPLLHRGDDNPGPLTLSPDGRRLLFHVSVYSQPPPGAPGTDRDAYRGFQKHLLDLTTLQESALRDDIDRCQWVTGDIAVCSVKASDDADRGLYLINFETDSRQKILTGFEPTTFIQAFSASPDNQQLMVSERLSNGDPQEEKTVVVHVMIDGKLRTDLLTVPSRVVDGTVNVSWSPSGDWAVVHIDRLPGPATFWIAETQEWELWQVAETPGIADVLGWSPDEREVLTYACGTDYGNSLGRIVAVSRDGTGVRTLATPRGPEGTSNACGRGRLSADRNSFLFWFPLGTAPLEQWGLYVTDESLSQLKEILPGYQIEDAIWLRP